MELSEVMRTTFAAREFLDQEVSNEQIGRILDNARFAPSGGNRQGWKVIIVKKEETRAALVPLIEPVFRRYLAQVQAGESPWNTINETRLTQKEIDLQELPRGFIENLVRAPVLLFVFLDLSVVASFDSKLDRVGVISGASVYPFVWNILLAARNEGLGGTITTFVGGSESDLRDLLRVPSNYAFSAMIPMGKPIKQLTRLSRNPVSSFAVLDTFDGASLG
ncbi:MAG: nitroreductase family protein [Candidatus Azotimanducaceae bacterium]